MTSAHAQEYCRAMFGSRVWVEGSTGHWYMTRDQEDNTSGVTYEKPEHIVRDIVRAVGFILFPDDWTKGMRLKALTEIHPGEGFVIRIDMRDQDVPADETAAEEAVEAEESKPETADEPETVTTEAQIETGTESKIESVPVTA